MKKIKLNKVKLALGLLGIIGATALVAPILVSCSDSNKPTTPDVKPPVDPEKPPVDPEKPPVDPEKPPVDPEKPVDGITAKKTNNLSIWEINAIVADKKNWTVSLLSKAFDGIDATTIKTIESAESSNDGVITLKISGNLSVSSITSTNTWTVLDYSVTSTYFASNGIWAGKTTIGEVELKGTTEIAGSAFQSQKLISVTIPNTVTVIGYGAFQNNEIKELVLGNNVQVIGHAAFFNNQLSHVTIPDSVEYLGYKSFYGFGNSFDENQVAINKIVLDRKLGWKLAEDGNPMPDNDDSSTTTIGNSYLSIFGKNEI